MYLVVMVGFFFFFFYALVKLLEDFPEPLIYSEGPQILAHGVVEYPDEGMIETES